MVSQHLSSLSAVRKQHLLVEFSSLKYACPHGVFMSLTPGDPTLWSGVIFVRKGPYAPAILRFQISFPPTYPALPPLVTFSTDIFHPLVTPLTTYMYTTDIQDSGTVSATDEERLPPGGFSLRHGFPAWFGRASSRRSAERVRGGGAGLQTPGRSGGVESPGSGSGRTGDSGVSASGGTLGQAERRKSEVSTYDVLRYIRSTFDDEDILDSVPLEAAGNPGAWHAWRTYRVKSGKILNAESGAKEKTAWHEGLSDGEESPSGYQRVAGGSSSPMTSRRPGEWNWDGVWEVRVKKGVEGSLAESALYGKDAGDDLIRFLSMEGEEVDTVKENIKRSLEVEPQRRGVV
ncbi:UBC-like protein [Stipitochalara longipes BDJ]|nr:UBC-like protein [Stipitochalara longipes BDJ]